MSGRERNCCFINTLGSEDAARRFATASAVSGLDFDDDGRAAAQVDWDHDGDLDLWLTNRNAPRLRFMRNESPGENDFLQIRLVGNGSDTNRNAIGARVRVTLETEDPNGNPVQLLRTLRAGEGFLSQSSQWLHFGLGGNAEIKDVQVTWPNQTNRTESFSGTQPNGRYVILQSDSAEQDSELAKTETTRDRASLALKTSTLKVPAPGLAMRVPLLHQFKAPLLGYYDYDGKPVDFDLKPNTVTLINLWSTTCAPCVKELKEFTQRHQELQDAGVRILALSIDELQEMDDARTNSKAMAERMKFSFTSGMAPPSIISDLQQLHNALIKMERALPMPTSFLIDRNGRLQTIYKGAVSVETILEDAKPRELSLHERFVDASPFSGSMLDNDIVNRTLDSSQASVLIQLAKDYVKQRRLPDAIRTYKDALLQLPEAPALHNELAIILDAQNQNQEALFHYQKAAELRPDNSGAKVNAAQVLIRLRKYEQAKESLEEALKLTPGYADAHYNLGVVHGALKDKAAEKSNYEAALATRPGHPQALFRLGRYYEQKGDWGQAKPYYEKAVAAAPKQPAVLTRLAMAIMQVDGDTAEATRLLRNATEVGGGYAEAHYQLGKLLLDGGSADAARREFMATLRINSNHRGARQAINSMR